jgi:sugar O-acyltransferase (sialic acid O-acetyltransferase NeuD family)
MRQKKKEKIIVFGSGAHAKVLISEIKKIKKFKIEGIVDKKIDRKNKIYLKKNLIKYLGNFNFFFNKYYRKNIKGVIGVGNNFIREKMFNEITAYKKNIKWAKIISTDTIISKDVLIEEGSVVISGTIINTGTKIGKHCLINTRSTIDHDNSFKDFSSTGPGSITGGNVKLGKRSHLGIGCVIKNSIAIGDDTIIGGKAFVNKNCKDRSVYFGVPAKKKKNRTIKHKYF